MKPCILWILCVFCLGLTARAQDAVAAQTAPATVYPIAILPFSERGPGMEGMGQTVTDLLFAHLAEVPTVTLVERQELDKVLSEAELSLSGAVNPGQATQVGQLTGAKILLTGSVFRAGRDTYIVAKMIGTETGRVIGKSVNGTDAVGQLSEQLSKELSTMIGTKGAELVPKEPTREDRLTALRKELGTRKLPTASVAITERHIGRQTIDPAAQTELAKYYSDLGGVLVEPGVGGAVPELRIVGEGISEFSTRLHNLVSVKARVEVKVLNQRDEVVAVDRQTVVVVDLNEIVGGKTALQEAAAQIAGRLLPKLAH